MPETRRPSQRTLRSSSAARIEKAPRAGRSTRRSRGSTVQQADNEHSKPRRGKAKLTPSTPSFLQRSQADADADPNRQTLLLRLPRELIREIAGLLPPESLVCLTLTCKEALHVLGTSSWSRTDVRQRWYESPATGIQHRPLLLKLLLRDAPDADFCARCNTLHPPLRPPRCYRPTRLTRNCFGPDNAIDYWPQDASKGYCLVLSHVEQVFLAPHEASPGAVSPPIDLLSGDCIAQRDHVRHTLHMSARWIDRFLILRQEHRLCSTVHGTPLRAKDVLALPFRLCPHQTTSVSPPPTSYHTRDHVANGPVLTHAVATAFPTAMRTGIPAASTFRKPKPSEARQMAAANRGDGVLWRCTSCPTKFRAVYACDGAEGELVVTAWQCFGRELYDVPSFWRMLVRREGPNLGPKKRNSEFYALSQSMPDFRCE